MTREIALFIVLAIGALALWAAWRGWRRKVGKFSHLPALSGEDTLPGIPRSIFTVMYMATTPTDSPWERVAVAPLAYRAKSTVEVRPGGVVLGLTGEGSVAIPTQAITGVGVATWTIDKVVDSDGLVFLRWLWGDLQVDSYFRVVDHAQQDVISEISSLLDEKEENISGQR